MEFLSCNFRETDGTILKKKKKLKILNQHSLQLSFRLCYLYGLDATIVDVLLDIREHECLCLSVGFASRRIARPYLQQRKSTTRLCTNFRDDVVALLTRTEAQSAQLSQWLLFNQVQQLLYLTLPSVLPTPSLYNRQ